MNAIIITIGDEILNGDTVDTNSTFLALSLREIGVKIAEIRSIADDRQSILNALKEASNQADLIITTGGLGPTKDDLTKETVAEYCNVELIEDSELKNKIYSFYKKKNRLHSITKKMYTKPNGSTLLANDYGIAPCIWIKKNQTIIATLPGVPYEMKGITTEQLIPKILASFSLPTIRYHYFITSGAGETILAEKLQEIEENLPSHLSISYLPSFGGVKVRLSGMGNQAEIDSYFNKKIPEITKTLVDFTYSEDKDDNLAKAVAKLCVEKNISIATAESCTGGNIAKDITANAGSSAYFKGSIIAYSNEVKINLLGVNPDTIKNHGAVSEQTVIEMVKGTLSSLNVDFAVATSGIAGPDGGTDHKPVGTVCIAVGNQHNIQSKTFTFATQREKNIQLFTMAALHMLFHLIKEEK